MAQRWTVEGRIAGDFYLAQQSGAASSTPLVEGLTSLRIEPEFGQEPEAAFTGRHIVRATVQIPEESDGTVSGQLVDELARRLLDTVASLAAVATARRVWRIRGYTAVYKTDVNPPRIRKIAGEARNASLEPPAELTLDVFVKPVSERSRRVIRWWARGLASPDPVDSLVSFGNALDHISGDIEGAPPQTRTCPSCGHVVTMAPGGKQKILRYLESVGIEPDLAQQIYASRNKVAHAGSDLDRDDLHTFSDHAHSLAHALHKGIATRIGVEIGEMPQHLPLNADSAFLDIEGIGASEVGERATGDETE